MNAARLLKLAAFLHQLPPQKFDFSEVAFQDEKPMLEALKARKEDCGTVACAMGWCPAVFPKDITWKNKDQGGQLHVSLIKSPWTEDFEMAEKFFELSELEAGYLFKPFASHLDDEATAKEVAKLIRDFVKGKTIAQPLLDRAASLRKELDIIRGKLGKIKGLPARKEDADDEDDWY